MLIFIQLLQNFDVLPVSGHSLNLSKMFINRKYILQSLFVFDNLVFIYPLRLAGLVTGVVGRAPGAVSKYVLVELVHHGPVPVFVKLGQLQLIVLEVLNLDLLLVTDKLVDQNLIVKSYVLA